MSYDGYKQFINIIYPPPKKKIYIENNTQLKTFPSYSVIKSIGVLTYFLNCHV